MCFGIAQALPAQRTGGSTPPLNLQNQPHWAVIGPKDFVVDEDVFESDIVHHILGNKEAMRQPAFLVGLGVFQVDLVTDSVHVRN